MGSDKPASDQLTQADEEPTTQWKSPIQELLSSLRQSQKSNTLAIPHHRSERVWTLHSLRAIIPLLQEWKEKDVKWVEGKAMKIERLLATSRNTKAQAIAA
jgi:hypothetical protein